MAGGTLPPCGRENSPYRHPANKDSISTPPLGEAHPVVPGWSKCSIRCRALAICGARGTRDGEGAIAERVSDETSCAAFLFERRWPEGFVCPACGAGRAALLRSRAHTDELLGYRRARQSPQRRAANPAPAAAPKDCDRHAGRRTKTSRKTRTQSRFGSDPPALDFD